MKNKTPVIGIIGGRGRMGRLFVEFFEERNVEVLISDLGTKFSNKDLAKSCDIVIVSVPIDKTKKVIEEVLPYLKKGSAVTDFTSVKEMPINAMLNGKNGVEVFGMHPMFGNSNPIPGQTILMCPTKRAGTYFEWMQKFLVTNGAVVKVMKAHEHDHLMAVAQDLIHFIEITCADGLRLSGISIKNLLPYISKASELKIMSSARILDQDAGLYGNMQMENSYNLKFLNDYKKTVENLISIIQKKDLSAFKKYFATTNKYLDKYADEAYVESSFLIDKLIENRNKKSAQKFIKKELPSKKHIAVLGPKYTFSELAADKFNKNAKKYYAKDIEEVVGLVEAGKVLQGIVPIENKLDGTIRETLDLLFSKKVHISSIINLPINHCLVVLSHTKAEDVKYVISHQQALNQCKQYLKKHFSAISQEAYSSTAAAIEKMIFSNDKTLAVIASLEAAIAHDLKIFADKIEDDHDNNTKFFVIEKGDYKATKSVQKNSTKNAKTSIAFYFDKDSPGSLFTVFKDFAEAKINLTKIESRPTRKEFGDYIFYLDFEGTPESPKVKPTLKKITQKVSRLKILGVY
jgi:prephenate dehydratase/prephenate dehydrogenase